MHVDNSAKESLRRPLIKAVLWLLAGLLLPLAMFPLASMVGDNWGAVALVFGPSLVSLVFALKEYGEVHHILMAKIGLHGKQQ